MEIPLLGSAYSDKFLQNKNGALKIALMVVSVGVSSPSIFSPTTTIAGVQPATGQFSTSSNAFDETAVKLLQIEKRIREVKKRLFDAGVVRLPDSISGYPWFTAEILALKGIVPKYINSSSEDELAIEFDYHDSEYSIWFLSSGEIEFLIKKGKDIFAWELDRTTFFEKLLDKLG